MLSFVALGYIVIVAKLKNALIFYSPVDGRATVKFFKYCFKSSLNTAGYDYQNTE